LIIQWITPARRDITGCTPKGETVDFTKSSDKAKTDFLKGLDSAKQFIILDNAIAKLMISAVDFQQAMQDATF
jgi:hypothetical protein